ncbi:glucokinase [Azorhizobium oxalatiphilum]|uniref:Glucokinase n=1 Tax=Azorhizobium oxalatiphilum TaxID=980631 RepID=A0A917C6A4_9HYPH|nr:ROK family protein [Azorhizobium oxalatiphilum]GGF73997.1 glucokinase [Azorhizobium oxalatiphilum]
MAATAKSASSKSAGKSASKPSASKPAAKSADKSSSDAVPPIGVHGAAQLPGIEVTSYNLEVKDKDGFVGDKASGRAFRAFVHDWRTKLREIGKDPFEEDLDAHISKKTMDKVLAGDPEGAAVVHGAIEDFARNFAYVAKRFLAQKDWEGVERIVVGGGLSDSRVGAVAVARANALLVADDVKVPLELLRHHPDEGGLIGCLHLAPSWIFSGYDGIIAVDIGGSNIRCGMVRHNAEKDAELKKADVCRFELWRHADEDKLSRTAAVERVVKMIKGLITQAETDKLKVAPFIGIACPGLINDDGSIARGAQNLPGKWDSDHFLLPEEVRKAIPAIGEHDTMVVMHNDAVIQGLSARPWMGKTKKWAALTIGTGLGNACYRNRE